MKPQNRVWRWRESLNSLPNSDKHTDPRHAERRTYIESEINNDTIQPKIAWIPLVSGIDRNCYTFAWLPLPRRSVSVRPTQPDAVRYYGN
ncbi:MAG: hypothetical protein R3F19_32550 [Verrucomicrobiales bacterium]